MSSEPCNCDEAKAWRERALAAESNLSTARQGLQSMLLRLDEALKPPEAREVLPEARPTPDGPGATTAMLIDAKAWLQLNPYALVIVVCANPRCARHVHVLALHLELDIERTLVTTPIPAMEVARGLMYKVYFDHSLSEYKGDLFAIKFHLNARALP